MIYRNMVLLAAGSLFFFAAAQWWPSESRVDHCRRSRPPAHDAPATVDVVPTDPVGSQSQRRASPPIPATTPTVHEPEAEALPKLGDAPSKACRDAVAIRCGDLVIPATIDDQHWPGHGSRAIPVFRDGSPRGFRLVGVQPNSVLDQVGLENGDVVLRVNGISVSTPNMALAAYDHLKCARALRIEIERRGRPVAFVCTLHRTMPVPAR